jgi:AcrR family transcriptional regulator
VIAIPTNTFHNLSFDKKFRILEASVDEFSKLPYEQVKLSEIIKNANIPRGSFYQYFEDKQDLFFYIFSKIAERKMDYMKDLLANQNDLDFLDLFNELFRRGAKFALENPRYVSIMALVMQNRNDLYHKLIGDNLVIAREYYVSFIEKDKQKGIISDTIDSITLANLVIELTTNVTLEQLMNGKEEMNYDQMINSIENVMSIFKKGILTGE